MAESEKDHADGTRPASSDGDESHPAEGARASSPSSPSSRDDDATDGATAEAKAATKAPAGARAKTPVPGTDGAGGATPRVPTEPLGPAWLPAAIATVLPALFFFVLPPLTRSGLWDPHELNVADHARRVALNLHGAQNLALEGADNSLPYLNDLGRPQLPFTSIALGFKLFGLHEWAGRAPLALWGLLGVVATYGFVSRLVDRRAGVFAAIALTTMPLYFVEARTMLGDACTMASLALAFGGFASATFGRRDDTDADARARVLWLVVGLGGLFCGYMSRGALLGLAVPAGGVGLAFLIAITNGQRFDKLATFAGGLAAVVGIVAAGFGIHALTAVHASDSTVPLVGAQFRPPMKYPTFDATIGHVASALAPWSAFAPFAFGRLFAAPIGVEPAARVRESQGRLVLVVGAALAFMLHGWIAMRTDLVAFAAPAIIAAGCGIALRDYERGAHPSIAVGVGTSVILGLIHHEMHKNPEKAFHAFGVTNATFPESFKNHSLAIWTIVLVGFAGLSFLTWVERDAEREPFDPKGYLRALLALRDAWDGMLALAYFAMVAGASLAGLAVWIGTRQHAKWLPTLSSQMRDAVTSAWWVTAFVPLGAVFAIYFWADAWLWAFNRARPLASADLTSPRALVRSAARGFEPFEELAARLKAGRLGTTLPRLVTGKISVTEDSLEEGVGPMAALVLAPLMYLQIPVAVFLALHFKGGLRPLVAGALAVPAGVAVFLLLGLIGDLFRGSRAALLVVFGATVGGILCFSYYPALANQLSPKEIFESYQRTHKGNEPLALFGVGGRTAAYYAGGQPLILKDTTTAYDWLVGGDPGTRRFLAVRAEELARLNRAYRERSGTGQNLPILDARSSQIVLAASALSEGEKNQNPLSRIVLPTPPKPQRKLDVNMEDKLQILGFDLTDLNGKLVETVAPGKKYHMKTYYKVLAPLTSEWEGFIHIDGFHKRHNGDHKICEGKYPMTLWLKDDIVVDDHEFSLEPNFSPGAYTIFFGLFVGETRLKVKSGPSDGENRVNGGALRVQ